MPKGARSTSWKWSAMRPTAAAPASLSVPIRRFSAPTAAFLPTSCTEWRVQRPFCSREFIFCGNARRNFCAKATLRRRKPNCISPTACAIFSTIRSAAAPPSIACRLPASRFWRATKAKSNGRLPGRKMKTAFATLTAIPSSPRRVAPTNWASNRLFCAD